MTPYTVICSSKSRRKWLRERAGMVTASDAAVVLGESPWSTPLQLYLEKQGLREPFQGNARTDAGLFYEATHIRFFQRRTGHRSLRSGKLLRSTLTPCMGATLDAWTTIDGHTVPLQVKNVEFGDKWEEGVPEPYRIQVVQEIYVTGAPFGVLAAVVGGWDLRWQIVERDEDLIARLIEACEDFMRRLDECDPPDSSNPKALAELYSEDDGTAVVLGQDAIEIDEKLTALREGINGLTAQRDELQAELMKMIGTASRGILPGGVGAYIWQTSARGTKYLRRVKG